MDYAQQNVQWSDVINYNYIISTTSPSIDPKVIIFHAILSKENKVNLMPFQIAEGIPDLSDKEYNYSVVALDAAGKVLKENRLNIRFEMYVEPIGAISLDTVSVVNSIEWVDGIQAIELRNKAGFTLARRDVSRNAPHVQLTSPKSGETWKTDRKYPITWEASDQDGDQLFFMLAISRDKNTWTPVILNVEDRKFDLDPALYQPGIYYLKIKVTDGINTNESMSDWFKIE